MNSLLKSSILFGALLVCFSIPWVHVSNENFVPVTLFAPFLTYIKDKLVMNSSPCYGSPLEVFVKSESSKYLGVPPQLGGPKNQIVFVENGFFSIASLLLVAIPKAGFQLLGLMVNTASTLSFIMLELAADAGPLCVGAFTSVALSLAGMFLVLL